MVAIAGGGSQRDDPTSTRPGPDRVGWLLPLYNNWPLFAIALGQRKTIFGLSLSPAQRAGALDMANVTVHIVFVNAQTRLQKGLIPRPDQKDTFRYRDRVGSGSGISTDCHLYYMQNSAGLCSVFIIRPVYHKNMRTNVLNNQHGDFCESGISACPESVGVGKFCRLRLRLRFRRKQPTPTDSDSGSDSDSAALDTTNTAFVVWKYFSCIKKPLILRFDKTKMVLKPLIMLFYPILFSLLPVMMAELLRRKVIQLGARDTNKLWGCINSRWPISWLIPEMQYSVIYIIKFSNN